MIRILYFMLTIIVFGCTKFDKDNTYQPKPSPSHTIPNVTCNGEYFCKAFRLGSKVIKLTDSTFGIMENGGVRIFNDNGIQIDSVNIIQYTGGTANASGPIIPFWDESGFAIYNFYNVFFFSNKLEYLGKSRPGLTYNYDNNNIISAPDNSIILEAGNIFYSITKSQSATLIADLSSIVVDVISIACFPDGRIVAYTKKKDYPSDYEDIFAMYEISLNGNIKEISDWTFSTKLNYRANLTHQKNGNLSLLQYIDYQSYSPSTKVSYFDTTYSSFYTWSSYDLKDNSFQPNSTNSAIKSVYIGSGFSVVYVDFYFGSGFIFDSSGLVNEITGFYSSNNSVSLNQTAGKPKVIPISISAMRNNKLLVSSLQKQVPNYNFYCCESFLMVFLSDLDGKYCK